MTAEPIEPPVYKVTGTNWTMVVPLDEYNAQFDIESQTYEAATRAIEQLKGIRADLDLVMNPDSRDENPQLGVALLVTKYGEKSPMEHTILTYLCMGNTGFYKEAYLMFEDLQKKVAETHQREAEKQKLNADIKQFIELQKEYRETQDGK